MKSKIKKPIKGGLAKVPIVMQMESLECGAACLNMILAYYDKWVPLEKVRLDCGVSRDGSNAKNIIKAAKKYNLIAKGYRYEIDELRQQATFPCIIHWNFNHFVVLKGFKGNRVMINDPSDGSLSIPIEEFDKSFTGICLTFEPDEDFISSGKQKSVMSFVFKRLEKEKSSIIFLSITTFIISSIMIIKPVFLRVFIDRLITGKNLNWFNGFMLILILFSIIQVTITALKSIYMLRINGKLDAIGNTSYMWKILHLPMNFFHQRMAGDIQERKKMNANIAKKIVEVLIPLAFNISIMIFYLIIMIRYDLKLSLIGVSSIVINLVISVIISKKRMNITRVKMRDSAKLAGETINAIHMIETIKSSGMENNFFQRWAGYQASVNEQEVKYIKLSQYFGMIPLIITSLSGIAILSIGTFLTITEKFTIGMLIAFQSFLTAFTEPATKLIETNRSLQEMKTEVERIDDVMNYPKEISYELKDEIKYEKLTGNLEIKNLSFGYSHLEKPIITNFNLKLKQGQTVAIVGMSGCGKSTISKLISGLYKPWEGEILFDGKSIFEIDKNIFTGSLAVVDQEIILFEDTIANNIKMWDNSIEDFEMIIAARDAQLHEDIMQRDGGYQYRMLEGGKDFSGGQRQCIEIARVLAQDPTIIILDEATSALDSKTEYDVMKAIKDRGITCIVIAHRLSTIKDCDEIIVLDDGNIVEFGKHQELYSKNGVYTKLIDNK